MSKYKLRDKVLIEGEVTKIEDPENTIYRVSFQNGGYNMFREKWLSNSSKTYEDGLNDAWELARKVNAMSEDEFDKCFNFDWQCTTDFTYQEILAMVEAYEENKAIKVGDVVVANDGTKSVVIDDSQDEGYMWVFNENGCVEEIKIKHLKKTGRHIDIEHLLEQIRGNE